MRTEGVHHLRIVPTRGHELSSAEKRIVARMVIVAAEGMMRLAVPVEQSGGGHPRYVEVADLEVVSPEGPGRRDGRRGVPGWSSLTRAEHQIVRLISQGMTNPEIAQRLFVSRRTVESHVSSALRKLNLSTRVELALEAVRREPVRSDGEDGSQRGPTLAAR